MVLLPGGILEEHGPYLPAHTDGILSERLTQELARAIAAKKPGWKVLVFPPIPLGASGSNELGGHFTFAGTYAVRPATLRAVFMDLAAELGEQGFRWVIVVNVHGAPLHNRALDQASDFFRDTYGGRMVHLWGLVPVSAAGDAPSEPSAMPRRRRRAFHSTPVWTRRAFYSTCDPSSLRRRTRKLRSSPVTR